MRRVLAVLGGVMLVAACASSDDETTAATTTTQAAVSTSSPVPEPAALPLGDGRYTDAPTKGSVFSCQRFGAGGGGAFRDGPWIDATAKTWNPARKLAVQGSVDHHGQFSGSVSSAGADLSGNGLPTVPTGVFPVASSDPAFQYDRNPNTVTGYGLDVQLPAPETAPSPTCAGGTIGISVLGVPIYSAFDALGRDAAAHEVQDGCDGHPERTGQYHFHSLSACWADVAGFDPGLYGYALDGFGIYVEREPDGSLPSSAALDECHGRTSDVVWHGERTSIYHYVATADFPYLVGCFRGTPIASATGLHLGGGGGAPRLGLPRRPGSSRAPRRLARTRRPYP